MRMRRKKHRDERFENCSELFIDDILQYKNDLRAVFDDDKPLHLEIGCGKGKFVCEMAQLHPDVNFLAFEKNLDVAILAGEKVLNAGLKNVKFYCGDANVLNEFETESRADIIYLNFSDPWKKSKQKKRRLTHENFLSMYGKLLKKGGAVYFKTDNQKLFEFSLNSFADFGLRLHNITLDLHNSGFEGNVMTEYETRFSDLGQPIYRCEVYFD